jgi:hypothetical protein
MTFPGFIAVVAALVWVVAAICWAIGRFSPSGRAMEASRDFALLALGLVILTWFVHF